MGVGAVIIHGGSAGTESRGHGQHDGGQRGGAMRRRWRLAAAGGGKRGGRLVDGEEQRCLSPVEASRG
jgi:hypothetical protein